MAKMDWDRVNVENLDYRRKNEIERKEEENAFFPETGSSTLLPCPHSGLEVSASKYRFHLAERHFLKTGTVSITILIARLGNNGALFSVIPTCVFDDVWGLLRSSFDFNQQYSSEEIGNNLPTEIRRFLFEVRLIDLSEKLQCDIWPITAEIIRGVAEKFCWFAQPGEGISLRLRQFGFDGSFLQALLDLLRKKKGWAKRNRNRRRTEIVREIANVERKLELAETDEHKDNLEKIRQRLIAELAQVRSS